MSAEPESLYLYDDATSYAAQLVLPALYDGPINIVNYTYEPVILETLPSFENGDARVESVAVQQGDRVVDADGQVVTLEAGVRIRPAGCRNDECAVAFGDEPVQMDRMQVLFRLLPDLAWSDGTPLTALDSVYSFVIASAPETIKGKWLELRTASYVAQDELTIVWTGLPGHLDAAYMTNFWTPLPSHAWDDIAVADLSTQRVATRAPLGYGPYMIENWVAERLIRMRPNPYYTRATESAPLFDSVDFRFITPDEAVTALADGVCDVLTRELYPENYMAELRDLVAAGQAQTFTLAGPVWEHLTFNLAPPPDYDAAPMFAQPQTRRAVAACIDRQRIVDMATAGLGTVLESYVAAEQPLYTADVPSLPAYDPAWGQAELEVAGWRDDDGNGIREAHGITGTVEGTPFQIAYVTVDSPLRLQVASVITQNLMDCGLAADVITYTQVDFFAAGPGTPLAGRHFDALAYAWMMGVQPACSLYLGTAIPSDANQWDGENFSGYASPAYDAACSAALAALPGESDYDSAHREALRIFAEDVPALPLYQRPQVYAARPNLHGFQPESLMPETWNLATWWIE